MQAVIQHGRHLLWREAFASCQIRTADITDEERVPRQGFHGFVEAGGIVHENGDTLGRVAGSFQNAQKNIANL